MRRKKIRWQRLSAAIISLLMFSVPALAGDLNPIAPPGPTMKTLDEIPAKDEVIAPWSQKLPANDGTPCNSSRFKCVMSDTAVLDKETGLVWARTPGSTQGNFWDAINACTWTPIAGRLGWRLPTIHELASLIDISVSGSPKLPNGHPFNNIQSWSYWSSTLAGDGTARAWGVNFIDGTVGNGDQNNLSYRWCVRSGNNHEIPLTR